jgi:hypothetical protein
MGWCYPSAKHNQAWTEARKQRVRQMGVSESVAGICPSACAGSNSECDLNLFGRFITNTAEAETFLKLKSLRTKQTKDFFKVCFLPF